MNRLSRIPLARLEAMPTDRFFAWLDDGREVDVSAARTLCEAIDLAKVRCAHKRYFVIQQDRADARRFLHSFYISKSSRTGTWRKALDGGPKVFEGDHEAQEQWTMQVYAPLAPVPPWQWSESDRTGARYGICPDLAADAPLIVEVQS